MLSSTALAVASRSFLPVLASSAAFAALLKRASARSRSSFVMSGRFLFLRLGFGFDRVGAVGGFLRQPDRPQGRRPLADRDIRGRDIGHRLDAFGVLGELSVEPDLLHLGRGFRFIVHKAPQIRRAESWRGWSHLTDTMFPHAKAARLRAFSAENRKQLT